MTENDPASLKAEQDTQFKALGGRFKPENDTTLAQSPAISPNKRSGFRGSRVQELKPRTLNAEP